LTAGSTAPPVLRMAGVTFLYPEAAVPAVEAFDLEVSAGEVVGLIGPNGAGKSTVLRLAAGLHAPSAGRVTVGGDEPARLRRREAARRVALVPAALHVSFPMPVRDLVSLGRTPHLRGVVESATDRAAVREALDQVHASDLAGRDFDRLSAGEQKRVLVARALAQAPQVLLLDEPTANLDIAQGVAVLGRLSGLARERGMAVVAAIHDLNLALLYCDRVVLLKAGRPVAIGEPEAALSYAVVREVFGCEVYVGRNELNGRVFLVPMETRRDGA